MNVYFEVRDLEQEYFFPNVLCIEIDIRRTTVYEFQNSFEDRRNESFLFVEHGKISLR